jgi:anti-sigma B factor antagonist/stage II sporulation protein AA (anti-sigma F factor antagonist)
MQVRPARFADVVVLSVLGRVDHGTSEGFRTALVPHLERCAKGQDHLVLDCTGMDYISSAGLRVFMLAARQVKAQQGWLALAAVQPLVREVLEITKFTQVLRIEPTVRAAVSAASAAALAALDGR